MSEHRQDPFWLRWDFIEKIANNELNKLVLLIPVFGYLLLFNDSFVEALAFNRIAGVSADQPSPFFLGSVAKLRLAFFGSLILLGANMLFKLFAPIELQQAKTEIAYAELVVSAFSREEVIAIETEVLSEAWKVRTSFAENKVFGPKIIKRQPRLKSLTLLAYLEREDKDYLRLIAREFWVGQIHSHPLARLLTLVICTLGLVMLALPTLDITQAVIIDFISSSF